MPHEQFEQRKQRERALDERIRRRTVGIRRRGERPIPGVPSLARWQLVLVVALVPLVAVFVAALAQGERPLTALIGTGVFAVLAAACGGVGVGWAALRRSVRRRR